MSISVKEVVNQGLFNRPLLNDLRSVFVHDSILGKCRKFFDVSLECVSYKLQIGVKCYDVSVFTLPARYDLEEDYIHQFIYNSQISFPWEENPTLFIKSESFIVLKEFIRNHDLKSHILKIEDRPAISASDHIIKVITFDRAVSELNIIDKYWDHLEATKVYQVPQYYYITYCFEWLNPQNINHFTTPIGDQLYAVLPITLRHLTTLRYTNQLNIYDLLMLRFTLCDYRNPVPSNYIKYELDFMIRQILSRIVQNDHLNLHQYASTNNLLHNPFLIRYLCVEFQNEFKTIETIPITPFCTSQYKIDDRIELARECDAIATIKQKSNIKFLVHGSAYDQMSLSLLFDLIECDNVHTIVLDTNCTWLGNRSNLDRRMKDRAIVVRLIGRNTNNYIGELVSALKSVTITKGRIHLQVLCDLDDYTIFDNLSITSTVEFYGIKIYDRMLDDLHTCNLKSKIKIFSAHFDNSLHSWQQLNTLQELSTVEIYEEEDTILSMLEFISHELHLKPCSNEFLFNRFDLAIVYSTKLYFLDIMFKIDHLESKLVLQNTRSAEIIDLYNLKFNVKPDDKSDFDFYE